MKRPVVQSPAAIADLLDHFSYLAQQSPDLGQRFLDEVAASYELLALTPELGAIYPSNHPRLGNIRVWSVKGFAKYLIFYFANERTVEVVRVLHGARDLDVILGAS